MRRSLRITYLAAIAIGLVILGCRTDAHADGSFRSSISSGHVDLGEAFTFFFLMLGPFKLLGPFAKMTEGADFRRRGQLAIRATIFSCLALVAAALIGVRTLENYGVSLHVMALTGGLVLSVVAFQAILQQFPPSQDKTETEVLPPDLAARHLAFPNMITPYGIAAVIIFIAIAPDISTKMAVMLIALGVLLLDLLAMLAVRPLLRLLGAPLLILGVVLAIVQLALGVQLIVGSLAAIGVFAFRS